MSPSSIDQGARVAVATSVYTGQAGLRTTPTGGEFSAMAPLALGAFAPGGTVDGRAVRLLGARVSPADKRFLVVVFDWADGR